MSETSVTKSTCPYCGVGCGVLIEHSEHDVLGVRGDPDHPANFGRLCTKGATLHLSARPELRLIEPRLRRQRGASAEPIEWSSALALAAEKFAEAILKHGPDSVGFYISGQLLTEDYYVFNKLAKALIGTNNVDTNSRLCMSSAVAAYKQTLGADAPPCCYEDFDHASCILIAGANPAFAHPIAFRRIEDARARNPDLKLIVIDPRRTDTAVSADLHLAIAPGSDIVLFNAMLRVMIEDHLIDADYIRAHTEHFEALRSHVMAGSLSEAARLCAVAEADIIAAARTFGAAARPLSLWCQGLNQSQHGTHNGTALIALSLALGKIGVPGCGPFSLTGQPNAMGGREVGGLSNLLPAHRDLGNPAHRAEVAKFWGVASIPEKPGYSAVEMFDAAAAGRLKALWIVCTNPAHSMPDQAQVRRALERCDFVIVQDAFASTETAHYADLLLPASTWGEKEGTVTNSERCITHVNRAIVPAGQARPDWRIAADFARALAPRLGRSGDAAKFDYADPEAVFREHVATTIGRDVDIGALSYQVLDQIGPQQWPMRAGEKRGRARLYADGRFETANGRARFVLPVSTLTAESTSRRYRFHLTTGRLRDQWHGMSRTGNVAQLMNHCGEPRIDMAKSDMKSAGIKDGMLVEVAGRRSVIILPAFASEELRAGDAFIAMHWGNNVLNSAGANALMSSAFDPYSKQPELKHASVAIRPRSFAHQLVVLRTERDAAKATSLALTRAEEIKQLLGSQAFASLSIAGRERPTVIVRMATDQAFEPSLIAAIDRIFNFDHAGAMTYRDGARGIDKRALTEDDRLTGVRFVGETLAIPWLRDLIIEQHDIKGLRRSILAPLAASPAPLVARGTIVCNCLNVGSVQIDAVLSEGADLGALQARLGCGTSCGSCLPELRKRIGARDLRGHALMAA